MKFGMCKHIVFVMAIALLPWSEAAAQWVNSPVARPTQIADRGKENAIFINPFGIVFGVFTGEFERKLNPSLSLAVAATFWDKPTGIDSRYHGATMALRFYPMEQVFNGFSISPLLGFVSFDEEPDPCTPSANTSCNRKKTSNGIYGVQVDYGWLLGPSQRFAVGTGLGVRRIIGSTGGDTKIIPAARFQIGYAF